MDAELGRRPSAGGETPRVTRSESRVRAATVAVAVAVAVGVAACVTLAVTHWAELSASGVSTTGVDITGASVDPEVPIALKNFAGLASDPPPALTAVGMGNSDTRRLSMPWQLLAINNSTNTVTIFYAKGDAGCVSADDIVVAQTESSVAIEPVSLLDESQVACGNSVVTGAAVVTLKTPLGTRPLLHPVVDPDWQNVLTEFLG